MVRMGVGAVAAEKLSPTTGVDDMNMMRLCPFMPSTKPNAHD